MGVNNDNSWLEKFKRASNAAASGVSQVMAHQHDWKDPYQDQYMSYLNQYVNREPFSYDINGDALYQQLRDNYTQQGKMAMMDTMGQAAAMTGGYGNSYAQSVGQQAYNQQLSQLNEIAPELYSMAYDQYQQEGQDILSKYSLYQDLSDQSYQKYIAVQTRKDTAKTELLGLMATGYEPSDAELIAAGMTKKQAEGYKNAYKYAEPKENKYTEFEFGDDTYAAMQNAVDNATSVPELQMLRSIWFNMGYDPSVTEVMIDRRMEEIARTNSLDTCVPDLTQSLTWPSNAFSKG